MRKIKTNASGFARLYGAKDLEQFRSQIAFMRDFEDSYGRTDIPFSDGCPTYADMSTAQLRCYFTWRTLTRQGDWRPLPFSYVLLRLFELMNCAQAPEEQAAQLAEVWRRTRAWHNRLDTRMPQWYKDYCLCNGLDFYELIRRHGLERYYPPPRSERLSDNASYDCRGSRFFRERPDLLPLLEQAVDAALENLVPLFALYNLSPQEAFFPQPVRFSFYEPFQGAAVLPPETHENREVKLSPWEVYRLWGGRWSRAFEDAFRPPSHAAGWLVKRVEAVLRDSVGFQAPWNDPEGHELRERWLHSEAPHPALFALLEDPRLPALIAETARALCDGTLPASGLVPSAQALADALEREPFFSIRKAQQITRGSEDSRFIRQGKLLAKLEDNCPVHHSCSLQSPNYEDLSLDQLRSYLTWRSALRRGEPFKTDSAYALLHLKELRCGIGVKDVFTALCQYLRDYGSYDKVLTRRLPDQILQCKKDPQLPQLLKGMGVASWFPGMFLFSDTDQLAVFQQLSSYNLSRSRFYRAVQPPLFRDCFTAALEAAREAFAHAGYDLPRLMCDPGGEPLPFAGAFASYLLKRTEQRMRELASFAYTIHADPKQMLGNAAHGNRKLQNFFCSAALSRAIDTAVEQYAQDHNFAPARWGATAPRKRKAVPAQTLPPPPPKPVQVDFSQLGRIRDEARALTELLIVEDETPPLPAPPPTPPPPVVLPGGTLREALSPAQTAIVNFLLVGEGPPPPMDELILEELNEIALDILGDTLIETQGSRPCVYEEYAQAWKDGTL